MVEGINNKFFMDENHNKALKIAVSEFSKLNIDKGKEYTIKDFKNGSTNWMNQNQTKRD